MIHTSPEQYKERERTAKMLVMTCSVVVVLGWLAWALTQWVRPKVVAVTQEPQQGLTTTLERQWKEGTGEIHQAWSTFQERLKLEKSFAEFVKQHTPSKP